MVLCVYTGFSPVDGKRIGLTLPVRSAGPASFHE